MHIGSRAALVVVVVAGAVALAQQQGAGTRDQSSPVLVERLATLEFPWGMAALPDGRVLVTEKPGRLRLFSEGRLSAPITETPVVAYRAGTSDQGGLLDVAVDPDFARNGLVYLSYSEQAAEASPDPPAPDPRFGNGLDLSDRRVMGGAVMRGRLEGGRLTDGQVIWRQDPRTVGRGHFGHRLVFGLDGTLFITSGERMRFDPAQSLTSNLGKIVRIHPDGSVPKDNPFVGRPATRADLWSVGHRNMLAAAVHPQTGRMWVAEMGPLGGDELNVIAPGANYGWPVVSDGDNYDRSPIPDHRTRPAFTAPVRTWTPVISPSGALFYRGTRFPWRGNLVVGGLSSKGLVRLMLDGERVTGEERIDLQRRVRDVLEDRDGSLLVLTDDRNGELLRILPGASTRQ